MRLTCPNCDAQYEVPDDVVPTEGRDVQCSNCGQTWFQHHPDHAPLDADPDLEPDQVSNAIADVIDADEETAPPAEDPLPETDTPTQPDAETPKADPTPEPAAPPQENKGLDDLDDLDDLPVRSVAKAEPSTKPEPARRELDPAVADILRQEAETETAARDAAATSDPLESQPDLGLPGADDPVDEGARRTKEARERMARLRGEPEPMSEADVNAAAISSRRDLLPDIDEINSTLRTENDRGAGQAEIDAPSTQKRKRGFRRGFMMMLVLFVLLAALYIFAPQIAKAVPQLEGALNGYVAWVDQMRGWLDEKVQGLARSLDNMATQSAGE